MNSSVRMPWLGRVAASATSTRQGLKWAVYALPAVALVLCLGAVGPQLLGQGNLQSMAFQLPELGILTLAMVFPMLTGGINLSTVATANFSALVVALVLRQLDGVSLPIGVLTSIAVGAGLLTGYALGALAGALVAYVRVPSILATLALMTLLDGANLLLTGGTVISKFSPLLRDLGNSLWWGLPRPLWCFLAAAVLAHVVLAHTWLGRYFKLMGSNPKACAYSGVNVRACSVQAYALSGLLSALAGVVMMARFDSVNVSYGQSYLLLSILAAVLGGVSPQGGRAHVGTVVLALVMLQLISSSMNLLGWSNHLTLALWGLLLVGAVGLSRWGPATGRH